MSNKENPIDELDARIKNLIARLVGKVDKGIEAYSELLETIEDIQNLIKPFFTRSLYKTHPELCETIEAFYKVTFGFFSDMRPRFEQVENEVSTFLDLIESYKRGLNG